MTMQLIWWLGIVLEAGLLVRGLVGGHLRKYPFFFGYVGLVLALDCASFFYFHAGPRAYYYWYWGAQAVTLIVGYGIVLEIFRKSLSTYPGADRLGRYLVLGLFAVVFAYVGIRAGLRAGWSPATTVSELERDLRAVEALALATICLVIGYFRIPLGRNLKGLISGFGFFIASSVISLAVRSFMGQRFEGTFLYLQPICYLVTLGIWTATMWAYEPNPEPEALAAHADYETLAASTREALGVVRADVSRAVRP
jgi:hypothetical protein